MMSKKPTIHVRASAEDIDKWEIEAELAGLSLNRFIQDRLNSQNNGKLLPRVNQEMLKTSGRLRLKLYKLEWMAKEINQELNSQPVDELITHSGAVRAKLDQFSSPLIS